MIKNSSNSDPNKSLALPLHMFVSTTPLTFSFCDIEGIFLNRNQVLCFPIQQNSPKMRSTFKVMNLPGSWLILSFKS